MPDEARLSINQMTTWKQWSFALSVEGYARHGVRGISVWREKLMEFGITNGARLLDDVGMQVSGYCVGGLLTPPADEDFRARLDDNRRMIDEAAEINARCVVLISGGLPEGSTDIAAARARAKDGLAALIPYARSAGITLGLEPLHPMLCGLRSVMTTLAMGNDWLEEFDAGDTLGLVVDVYHVWWEPRLAEEIARAKGKICAFHVCDWLRDTRDVRLDRGMMGDGIIDIPAIRRMVEWTGYTGHCEVEIFSERDWWQRDPDEVVSIVKDRYRRFV